MDQREDERGGEQIGAGELVPCHLSADRRKVVEELEAPWKQDQPRVLQQRHRNEQRESPEVLQRESRRPAAEQPVALELSLVPDRDRDRDDRVRNDGEGAAEDASPV